MTSFKSLAVVIIGFAFLQATLASSNCVVQLFKWGPNDGDVNGKLWIWRGQDYPDIYNAPFQGVSTPIMDPEMQEREISSVRTIVVDDFACGACKIVAYSGKNLSGKCVEAVGGQVDFEFCVKSFTLKCNTDWVEEEEFEEEEEEEEEQQE